MTNAEKTRLVNALKSISGLEKKMQEVKTEMEKLNTVLLSLADKAFDEPVSRIEFLDRHKN